MIHLGRNYPKYGRPLSWSQIARKYADRMIRSATYSIAEGDKTREEASKWMQKTISNSVYSSRDWMLKRAAKRLHRKGWI